MTGKVRKPYRGDGVAVPAVAPTSLPPEPREQNLTVQVQTNHWLYGRLPVFDRMVAHFVPRGWVPAHTYSWRDLCAMGGGAAPTVLYPRQVAP